MALRVQPLATGNYELTATPRDRAAEAADYIPPNINAVRGLACLLIVALHVIGDAGSNGLHLPMTSNWHYVMASIEFLRIPLFTALSGYLYAGHRVESHDFRRFWAKKLRRLVIPLAFTTVVVWWLRRDAYGAQVSLLHALLFQFEHLWFLQALLVLFVGISVADAFFRPGQTSIILIGLTAIMISQSGLSLTMFFGIPGAFYLAPYFLFGIVLREHPAWLQDRQTGLLALGVVLIVLLSQQCGMFALTNEVTLLQMPAAMAGMAGVVFLLQRFPQNPLLAHIGTYSYTIYLWHIVASAGVRNGLTRIGVTAPVALFPFCFIAGAIAPIVLYQVVRRIPLLSVACTGERSTARRSIPPVVSARQGVGNNSNHLTAID